MKGLVLSGGTGSRLRPITFSNAKQLIPIANKPILYYVLDDLAAAGIKEIGIIVGETKKEIKEAVQNGDRWGVRVTYLEQELPLGLAHAVQIAEPFLGAESFVMYLGDNLLKGGIKRFVNEYGSRGEDAICLLNRVDHPERFGVAEIDQQGQIKRLVEKPSHFISDLALVGIYIFNSKIFEAVDNIVPSWRGELEITDAIQYLIDQGSSVYSIQISDWWKDTGRKEDVLEANRFVLEDITADNLGRIDEGSVIYGKVRVGSNTVIKNSVIQGPAVIGESCIIENSYVGPYSSIGSSVELINCEIEQSVVMEKTRITNIGRRIASSLIGREVNLMSRKDKPNIHELLVGDQSLIKLFE